MKKLVEVANEELKKLLETDKPTWDTYSKIADLTASIQYMCGITMKDCNGSFSDTITTIRESFGDGKTLDIIIATLSSFADDLNCISPHLVNCLVKKLKENIE